MFERLFQVQKNVKQLRTRLINDSLSLLGHEDRPDKPRYKVYSHGLSEELQRPKGEFINVEWLVDVHWYIEGKEPYQVARVPLVVECEWEQKRKEERIDPNKGRDPYGAVKFDFQKLLVVNADLRVMIFQITGGKKHKKNAELDGYFETAINRYETLAEHAAFLFIAFDQKAKAFHYAKKTKRQSGSGS